MNKYLEGLDLTDKLPISLIPSAEFILKVNKLSKTAFEELFLDGCCLTETETKNIYNNRLRSKNLQTLYLVTVIIRLSNELLNEEEFKTNLNKQLQNLKENGINAIPFIIN